MCKEKKVIIQDVTKVWKSTESYFENEKKNKSIIFTALDRAVKDTRLYSRNFSLKDQEATTSKTEILVHDKSPIDEALCLKNTGSNPAIIVPSYAQFPNDKNTEEMYLRSAIAFVFDPKFKMQKKDFYSLKNQETIYSPNVPVVRFGPDKQYSLMNQPKGLSFVFSAPITTLSANKQELEKMMRRIYNQLYIAYSHHHDSLVLFPIGDSPQLIAKAYLNTIQKYFPKSFKKIVFAIPTTVFNQSKSKEILSIIKNQNG